MEELGSTETRFADTVGQDRVQTGPMRVRRGSMASKSTVLVLPRRWSASTDWDAIRHGLNAEIGRAHV